MLVSHADKCHLRPFTHALRWQHLIPRHGDAHYSHPQSPHTENFNKRLSFSIYIIYLWAVTSEVQIVFQALKPRPRDLIHFELKVQRW